MTEEPRGIDKLTEDAAGLHREIGKLAGQPEVSRREVLVAIHRLAGVVEALTGQMAEARSTSAIDMAHRLAWRRLETALGEKNSWGKNEVHARMSELLALSLDEAANRE